MIIRNQATDTQANKLLHIANNLLTVFNETTLDIYSTREYKEVEKRKKKIFKRYKKYSEPEKYNGEDLQEFCIPFDYIPDEIISFMKTIEWLDCETYTPINKHGFYSSSFHGFIEQHKRDTIIEWYIDLERYVEVLFIYERLKEQFSKKVA